MVRILVVDDCAADRHVIRRLLEKREEWQVEEASDGKQALANIRQSPPSLVLTDMQMPGLDGLELVRVLREQVPGLPVVLVTARGSEELAMKALRAGAAGYVPKRLLDSELVDVVDRVLDVALEQQNYYALLRELRRVRWRVSLPNDKTLIRALVSFVRRQMWEMHLGDEAQQFQVALALEEALSNALYHGNLELDSSLRQTDIDAFYQLAESRSRQAPYKDRRIEVTALLSPELVRLRVQDEGPGFDPAQIPDPTEAENLEKVSGRGILLMKTFMDSVRFLGRGNIVIMLKRLQPMPYFYKG
ncbi:MAG: hypothetical protein KatS3mg110_3687 [Pirellulaceae bacterium]|nr:MAG: hypothetical protein KatS3mg110_3687 [Pirellulaceae bacterium]